MATRNRGKEKVTRVGTRLKPEDKEYVLNTMRHDGETDSQFLRSHRFAVTKYGRLDRRTRMPTYRAQPGVTPLNMARAEVMRLRSIVRMVIEEMREE